MVKAKPANASDNENKYYPQNLRSMTNLQI